MNSVDFLVFFVVVQIVGTVSVVRPHPRNSSFCLLQVIVVVVVAAAAVVVVK